VAVPEPSGADGGLFGDERDAMLSEAIGICLVATRRELRAEYRTALAERDARIARLEGMLDAVLTMLGGDKKVGHVLHDSSVVELPRGFLRRVHTNG
jgi:hypothetical protein